MNGMPPRPSSQRAAAALASMDREEFDKMPREELAELLYRECRLHLAKRALDILRMCKQRHQLGGAYVHVENAIADLARMLE